MRKKYEVKLSTKERQYLKQLIRKGKVQARKITRSRILLLSDEGRSNSEIAELLSVTHNTIRTISGRYVEEGLEAALNERARPGAPTIFEGKARAKITALACSKAPEGRSQWSLRLLADRAVELALVESISHTDVRRILKKTKLNRT